MQRQQLRPPTPRCEPLFCGGVRQSTWTGGHSVRSCRQTRRGLPQVLAEAGSHTLPRETATIVTSHQCLPARWSRSSPSSRKPTGQRRDEASPSGSRRLPSTRCDRSPVHRERMSPTVRLRAKAKRPGRGRARWLATGDPGNGATTIRGEAKKHELIFFEKRSPDPAQSPLTRPARTFPRKATDRRTPLYSF